LSIAESAPACNLRLYTSLAAHHPKKILWNRIQPSCKVITPGGRWLT
jgi:hypothetical protein